jgi:hypothetical protein
VPVSGVAGQNTTLEDLHFDDGNTKPEHASVSIPQSDEGGDLNQNPYMHSQIETRNERIQASQDTEPVVKENIKISQSEDSESEYETDSRVESDEGKPSPHLRASSQPVIKPEPRLRGTDSDSYLDSGDSDSDESSSTRPQRGVKLEPTRESSQLDETHKQSASEADSNSESGSIFDDDSKELKNDREDNLSSGSDDDLPYDRHQKREDSYSSSDDEDEKNNLPLHSQPLSPVV